MRLRCAHRATGPTRSAINSQGTATVTFAINRQFSDAVPLPVSYRVIKAEKGRSGKGRSGAQPLRDRVGNNQG
ncbi:MAG: hypothetical protein GDA48_00365 [Hormoscilla sp. GM102CHS1]|nr:hypothetical protein [Hormoscilla sp. GM102CHS1]